jgi:hypothetical protein
MYVNGKIMFVETIPAMGKQEIKKNGGGVNPNKTYLIYCKSFSKCHKVSPSSTTINKHEQSQIVKEVIKNYLSRSITQKKRMLD